MEGEYLVDREWYDRVILKKPEYGTPEYWIKERKSKFRRDARKKEEQEYRMNAGIVSLWSRTQKVEMPLYNLISKTK